MYNLLNRAENYLIHINNSNLNVWKKAENLKSVAEVFRL